MTPKPSLPSDFAATGMALRLKTGARPTRFQVIGERSSGTNLTTRLLGRNSPMKSTDLLGWKHGFPHAMAIPDDMLVVGLVRDAVPWVRSMHAKPWHSDPAIQRLEFPDFLRSPWHSLIDRKDYFKGAEEAGVVGQPLQHDRHPITGRVFDNILEMRAVKLRALLGFFERDCNFLLLRAERVQEDPKAATRDILKALSFSQPEQFKGVHKRVGSKFNSRVGQRPPTPESLDEADLEFLRSSLDIELERTLGYSY